MALPTRYLTVKRRVRVRVRVILCTDMHMKSVSGNDLRFKLITNSVSIEVGRAVRGGGGGN